MQRRDSQAGAEREVLNLHRKLTYEIIGSAIAVHRDLGPGLLEKAYESFLVHEMTNRGLHVQRQVPVRVSRQGVEVGGGLPRRSRG